MLSVPGNAACSSLAVIPRVGPMVTAASLPAHAASTTAEMITESVVCGR